MPATGRSETTAGIIGVGDPSGCVISPAKRLPPMRLVPLAGLLCAVAGMPLTAQQSPPRGCPNPLHHQFDFWIGDWTVTDSAGTTPFGTNLVTREEDGCLLQEHWTGSKGGSGQSFNFYDNGLAHWEQVWVDNSSGTLHLAGQFAEGKMSLEGDTPGPNGSTVRNRIAWTPEPDGRVRQQWSVSSDGGKSWQLSFDGWYRKK